MDSIPTLTELKKLRVVDLKERLAKLGKSTSGLKADLIDRLHVALLEQAGNVDMGPHHGAGVAYPHQVDDLQPLNPEPPVVEVTIDTSQFDCGVVEPQIVTIEEYPIVENVGEVTIQSLHMDQMNEQDVGLYYQQQEEAERMQALLHQQQQEEELQRQQDEVERQRLQHEQILLQQRQQEEAELLRQRQIEEEERLRMEQEETIRWQQEELRILQEEENRRHQQELLIAQEKAEEEERIRCQQIEEENRRRLEEEEVERQRQELERMRWQREEEFRRSQEAEMLRQKKEMEEHFRREQEEAERSRREEEAAELARQEAERIRREAETERIIREQAEAERIWREREAERIRQEREAELIRMQREEDDRRRNEEAERVRRLEAERIRQEEEAENIRREKEAERIRQEEEDEKFQREQEAERIRQEHEAEKIRREHEAERIQQEQEAEHVRREEERRRREQAEVEQVRLQREKAEILRREQEALETQRIELEAAKRAKEAEMLRKEREEAERRKEQQELLIKQREEENERRKQEIERKKKEKEQKLREEEEERLRMKQLEAEEKERLHQEYLDKQTAAALIQIPVQIPASEGVLYHQSMVTGMTQPWPPVSQAGFPHQMVLPPPEVMMEDYNGSLLHPSEMTPMQHSASPPPIPGLGPPSQDKLDMGRPPALMSLDLHHPVDGDQEDDMRLPQALEKVLAYKMERAQMLGVDPDTIAAVEAGEEDAAEDEAVDMEVTVTGAEKSGAKSTEPKPSKNKQRKMKKKKRARNRRDVQHIREIGLDEETGETEPDVEVQYIEDSLDLNPTDPMYHHFMKIFEAFKLTDPEVARREAEEEAARLLLESKKEPDLRKKPKDADEDLEEDNLKKEETPKLSKRKLKKLNRLSIAELKQHVNRPDVVEMHDVTAKDPRLLVILKSTRNTVPVPRHWCFKRKFLQGKRGIEKPPFNLPDFIKKTGIMEMRQALQEKEDQKTLKAKMRERVRPKMGKIDIDYQKLHDAFFKWQTKPKMTIHGDLYYEGKEFETRLKEKKPGELSDDLRTALGMPVGPNSQKVPPPWLIAMQRYGPPPSYPNLKIPGLNSPIPDGCSFGYHAGGWGKPPVDEMGKPLYGDVFGLQGGGNQQTLPEEEVDRSLWGELESESESESEEEEEEEEEEEDEMELDDTDKSGFVTPAEGGLVTPSGISSIPMGMETPDMIELRKRKIESEMEGGETPALYTILPEKKTDRLGGAMMGSTHIYDIAAAMPGRPRLGGANTVEGGVDVALDPSELDLDAATMTARYEQTLREQQNQLEKEDLSDMVAEHSAKQKNKRKRAAGEQHTGRAVKKYKDFKF